MSYLHILSNVLSEVCKMLHKIFNQSDLLTILCIIRKGKGSKIVSIDAMKSCKEISDINPLIFELGCSWW